MTGASNRDKTMLPRWRMGASTRWLRARYRFATAWRHRETARTIEKLIDQRGGCRGGAAHGDVDGGRSGCVGSALSGTRAAGSGSAVTWAESAGTGVASAASGPRPGTAGGVVSVP